MRLKEGTVCQLRVLAWFLYAMADNVYQCAVVRQHSSISVHVSSVMPSGLVSRLDIVRPLSLAHFLINCTSSVIVGMIYFLLLIALWLS